MAKRPYLKRECSALGSFSPAEFSSCTTPTNQLFSHDQTHHPPLLVMGRRLRVNHRAAGLEGVVNFKRALEQWLDVEKSAQGVIPSSVKFRSLSNFFLWLITFQIANQQRIARRRGAVNHYKLRPFGVWLSLQRLVTHRAAADGSHARG